MSVDPWELENRVCSQGSAKPQHQQEPQTQHQGSSHAAVRTMETSQERFWAPHNYDHCSPV